MKTSPKERAMQLKKFLLNKSLVSSLLVLSMTPTSGLLAQSADQSAQMRELIEKQQKSMDELREKMAQQQAMLDALVKQQQEMAEKEKAKTKAVEESKAVASKKEAPKPAESALSVAGFKFSGDFRLRLDAIERSANSTLGSVHNVRGRMRFRLNVDKDLFPQLNFHTQIATGPLNNHLSTNQDFTSFALRNPINLSEMYVDYHPTKNFSLRGGKMEEVFADNTRYMFDDDVRFNGTHEKFRIPFNDLSSVEFRAGQYIFTNPQVPMAAKGSIWDQIGVLVGHQVRSSDMFDQGVVFKVGQSKTVTHTFTINMDIYHNANQIQLASIADGTTALSYSGLGVVLSGPLPGTGNATTTKGGPKYWASHFQVAHFTYDLQAPGFKWGEHDMPVGLNFQFSENVGTSYDRNGYQASFILGKVGKRWDPRFLYLYSWKDANSMISQFTDDDLGTGSGVNMNTHHFRFDLGLAKNVTWGNLFYIQNALRGNDPTRSFYVPYPKGAAQQYRFMTQLEFKF
jgi:hypothetical protein